MAAERSSTKSVLHHWFGTCVGGVRADLQREHVLRAAGRDPGQPLEDPHETRRRFVQKLEEAVRERVREEEGITHQHLREMIDLARARDWSKVETIKALYRRFCEITGERYDEKELFHWE